MFLLKSLDCMITVCNKNNILDSYLKPAKFGITDPTGIFVDNCDNVYIVEYEKRRIVKLNREMKSVTNA